MLTLTGQGDDRTLGISKSNWGPSFLQCKLERVPSDINAALLGFNSDRIFSWMNEQEMKNDPTAV